MQNIRDYRRQLVSMGQASPLFVGEETASMLSQILRNEGRDKISVLDVGCGSGIQMEVIQKTLRPHLKRTVGIDWSPATVQYHKSTNIFDEVLHTSASRLPFGDKEFDVAISLECLEHLYSTDVTRAINELLRVSSWVVITTPLPEHVINHNFLYSESVSAIIDPIPLSTHDFVCLESAVHKSTIFPDSMIEAGFNFHENRYNHGMYFGRSNRVVADRIAHVSIPPTEITDCP